jgi:prepilin-type N-terminal cleavage/methylation domain-containing protein
MAPKYTILKALIQTSNKGFTLIELLVGLIITFIITGLAMDAFINSSNSFRNDQRNIDNSQNLSAILEIIGNDIQQSGEQISEGTFPVIQIEPNTDAGSMTGSSKITIRRALTSSLTLCGPITPATTVTSLVVVDNSLGSNCSAAPSTTNTQQLSVSTPITPAPITSFIRPNTLMSARQYRCKLDNSTVDYATYDTTNAANPTTSIDYCLPSKVTPDLEKVRAAMSDTAGNIWTFDYVNDAVDTTTTVPNTKFNISIANVGTPPTTNNYTVGTTPIYLIEERIYTLDSAGNLNMKKDGGTSGTLITGIWKFNISAKVYTDTINKTIDPIDGTTLPATRRCEAATPNYICQFKSSTYPSDNWKQLAGIKIDLQAKYDGTGRNQTPTDVDLAKLSARAEFFPRNVLSK